MRTERTVEAEWWHVLLRSVSTGAKEDKSSTGPVWAAGFHHITARFRLARFLKLINHLFIYLFIFRIYFCPRKTADTESVDTGAQLYILAWNRFV
jgi:hypothetical protein